MKIPKEVKEIVNKRFSTKKQVHAPGCFESYRDSKTSACWGNNVVSENGYSVAFCQPSRRTSKDEMVVYYDFIKNE